MLRSGQLLPKPMRPTGGTGALRMAQVKQIPSGKPAEPGLDPITEANKKAVARLAEVVFDLSEETSGIHYTQARLAGHRPGERSGEGKLNDRAMSHAAHRPGHRCPDKGQTARPPMSSKKP